jgi:cysteine-rich repeat protein
MPGPPPGREHGHGNGHGIGHGAHPGPCTGHGNHSGPGGNSGGASSGSGGGSASAGTSSGPGAGSGGTSSGGTGSAGGGFGGYGGGLPGVCGDAMWGGNEQCDDGNAVAGDGCSAECQVEPHYACGYLGQPCQLVVCGDSLQQSYMLEDGTYVWEACDDGNVTPSDGCSASCEVESGWICEQPGIACRRPVCGDSRQDGWFVPGPGGGGGSGGSGGGSGGTYYYEECDDGNAVSGDGCTATCTNETGWVCPQPGVACHQPTCGDGFVDFIPGSGSGGTGGSGSAGASAGFGGSGGFGGGVSGSYEACDDGNTTLGDGCNAECSVEPGWSCNSWDGGCHVIVCGDGFADYPSEQCDDANGIANDGCTDCVWDNQGGFGGSAGGGFGGSGGFGG